MCTFHFIVLTIVTCFCTHLVNGQQLQCYVEVATEDMSTQNETTCSDGNICSKVEAQISTPLLPEFPSK